MQIEPQYTLPLVYELTDPFDTGVYYVRAIIRDSLSGETLQTINLIDKGNGRYTNSISAPQDPTGQGRHIDVVISIYTDAGYTTLSQTYQNKIDKFLIKRSVSFGGPGGPDVDYMKIQKIVENIVDKKIGSLKFPVTDLSEISSQIEGVKKAVEGINIPEPETYTPTDISPVLEAISSSTNEVKGAIQAIKIPEPEKVDLSPVIDGQASLKSSIDKLVDLITKQGSVIIETVKTMFKDMFKKYEERSNRASEIVKGLMEMDGPTVPAAPETPTNPGMDKFFKKS